MINGDLKYNFTSFEEMKDDLPKTVYKYRDWSNSFHKTIITKRQVYFAAPTSFEDPLDCKLRIQHENLTYKEKREWIAYKIKQNNPHYSRSQWRRKVNEIYKKSPLRSKSEILKIKNEAFEEYNSITGVLSLTANRFNDKMWQVYANKAEGFCVGFDPLVLFPYGGAGREVFYVDQLPILKPEPYTTPDQQRIYQVFYKLKKWSFEEEYRVHIARGKPLSDEDRKLTLPPEAYKELIVGSKMSSKDREDIISNLPPELGHINIIE